MSVVVETFVSRIRAIDEEVGALTELCAVVNDFLQAMLQRGITDISALLTSMGRWKSGLTRWKGARR
ncbi:MAG: hypothetical protein ACYC4R_17425 [Anaerolineae bacterium]